ncbi:MAG: AMP-binding protein [Nevskiales bacterium]
MDKIWLKQYPKGVPAEIDPGAFNSIAHVLEQSCARFADKPAYSSLGRTLSYAELDRLTRQFASFLQHTLGLKKGERVAVMMPNLLQYPVAIFGILRAGLVVVNVNPLYTPRELEHQLKDSGAKAIVIVENFIETLEKVIDNTPLAAVITTQIGDLLPFPRRTLLNFMLKHVKQVVPKWKIPGTIDFRGALAKGAQQAHTRVELNHQDVALLQYTGGTTGVS